MFRVTFNVSSGRLEKLLQAAKFINMPEPEIKYNGEAKGAVVTVKSKRANGEQILSLTGKKANKGSNREKILVLLEKLEVKHGPGSITREELKEACWKKEIDPYVLSQLINGGYIKVL